MYNYLIYLIIFVVLKIIIAYLCLVVYKKSSTPFFLWLLVAELFSILLLLEYVVFIVLSPQGELARNFLFKKYWLFIYYVNIAIFIIAELIIIYGLIDYRNTQVLIAKKRMPNSNEEESAIKSVVERAGLANSLKRLQQKSFVLVLEGALMCLFIVQIGFWLDARFLTDVGIDKSALFGTLYGLLFAPLLAGLWVAIWQTRENSLSWVVAGALGIILINNLTSGGYDYFYILPVGFVAWLGGKLGRRLKMRFRKHPIF